MIGYVTSTVKFEEIQWSCDNHVIFILAGREWNLMSSCMFITFLTCQEKRDDFDFDFEHELSESSYFDNAM